MDLQEEYVARHAMPVDVVRYVRQGYLVVQNNQPCSQNMPGWLVIHILYNDKPDTHPGVFRFLQEVPQHDAGSIGNHHFQIFWEKRLEWDQWESFIQDWVSVNRNQLQILTDEKLSLAVWEMFVYCFDSWLGNNLPHALLDRIFESVDESLDLTHRLAAVESLEQFIRSKNRSVASGLGPFHGIASDKHYAGWLAQALQRKHTDENHPNS